MTNRIIYLSKPFFSYVITDVFQISVMTHPQRPFHLTYPYCAIALPQPPNHHFLVNTTYITYCMIRGGLYRSVGIADTTCIRRPSVGFVVKLCTHAITPYSPTSVLNRLDNIEVFQHSEPIIQPTCRYPSWLVLLSLIK